MATTAESLSVPSYVPHDRVVHFDIYNPAPDGGDVTDAWKALRDVSKPIMWTTANGGHWLTTNGEMLRAVLRNHKTFSSAIIMAPREAGGLSDLLPITADPPRHLPLRALLNEALSPRAIQKIEAELRVYARELIEGFKDKGECDFMADFGRHFPIGAFFRLAHLPMEDYAQLADWMATIFHHGHSDGSVSQEDIMNRFADYLRPIIAARRDNPGDDLISAVASGKINGEPVDSEIAIKICRTLVLAGLDTVMALMSFTMHYLAGDPELQQRLADNPGDVPRAVDEFGRRFPIGINMRVLTSDIELDGVTLQADDLIATPIILHALDETEYADPERIDIDRESGGHTSFGAGIHRCAGTFLARAEMRVMLEEWLKAIPRFSLQPDAEIKVSVGFTTAIFQLPLRWDVAS